jgi:hypothetical protein
MMHGMFEFQIPSHLAKSLPLHNQEAYESFVDYLIVIGHDHRHKRNNKVVVPGSFDRITHGEEDPKGYLQFKLKPGKKTEVMFLENTAAEIYRSIDVTDLGLEEALEVIDTVINQMFSTIHQRCFFTTSIIITSVFNAFTNCRRSKST